MNLILGLILCAIFVYIGVNLLPGLMPAVSSVNTTAGYSSAVSGLAGIVPIVFAAMVIFGVLRMMSSFGSSSEDEVTIRLVKNPKDLVARIRLASQNLSQYINNLDDLLGIKTIIDSDYGAEYGLSLTDGELYICGGDDIWDWYIVDKHPDKVMFKVVGFNRNDKSQVAYIIGNEDGKPYLDKLSDVRKSCKELDTVMV